MDVKEKRNYDQRLVIDRYCYEEHEDLGNVKRIMDEEIGQQSCSRWGHALVVEVRIGIDEYRDDYDNDLILDVVKK